MGAPERELEDIAVIDQLAYKFDKHSGRLLFPGDTHDAIVA